VAELGLIARGLDLWKVAKEKEIRLVMAGDVQGAHGGDRFAAEESSAHRRCDDGAPTEEIGGGEAG